jgi:hypothetical protein
VPTFCRHSRLVQNCPICSREQAVEMRPVISPQGHPVRSARPAGEPVSARGQSARPATRARTAGSRGSGVIVRRLNRGVDDGYSCGLVPGLHSSADAGRLAEELAFSALRLARLATEPPGLYAEVAAADGSLEERTYLAFVIAYLGPTEDDAPFASIAVARRPWHPWQPPALPGPDGLGPRTAHEPARGDATVAAYRTWAQRAGGQVPAFTGESSWTPERRFARVFERLALPGMHRAARIELLASLGHLGLYELRADTLPLGGNDTVTLAAKRLLGIGDPMLLGRRATELAEGCGVPLEALDLGLYNWERGERARVGIEPDAEPDEARLAPIRAALEL